MVLLLTALIAFATTAGAPDTRRLLLLLTGMLFSQLAIGWSNDYLDRHVDALHQPAKPLPSGLVDARLMPPAIALVLIVSAIAGAMLGPLPLLLLAIGTLCGLGYNLGIKASRFGAVPFLLAFTVLPLYVWTALDAFSSDLLALFPIGLTLPVAVHLANVLPDLAADEAQGRMTLVVRLGRSKSILLVMACLTVPVLLTLLSLVWLDYERTFAVVLGAYLALSVCACGLYLRANRVSEVWAFRAIVVASIIFASGWLAAR